MRHLENLLALSRRALASALAPHPDRAPLAVDATAGNGHDTLFLARQAAGAGHPRTGDTAAERSLTGHFPKGHVWAFDVQEAALASARHRLAAEAPDLLDRVTFIRAGHETAGDALPPEARGNLLGITFNLGFLPGSDKRLVTAARTTLTALDRLSGMLAAGGVLSVHSYQGHAGGREEGEAVEAWFAALPWEAWRVARYAFPNKRRNPEVLFLAERLEGGA